LAFLDWSYAIKVCNKLSRPDGIESIAELLGKRGLIAAGRYEGLIPVILHMIETSWAPKAAAPDANRAKGTSEEGTIG